MLKVFGEDSLIVETISRALSVMDDKGSIYIVVSETLLDEVRNHIKSHDCCDKARIKYIVEPEARNTAPALALAAAMVKHEDPQSILMMLPSDHICPADEEWQRTIRSAVTRAYAGDLVTIGLNPTRPETGFGYIKAGEQILNETKGLDGRNAAYKVERFVEKPSLELAKEYLNVGSYFWNSGMLVAQAAQILDELSMATSLHPNGEFTSHSGQMAAVGQSLAEIGYEAYRMPVAQHLYSTLPAVPFDKAVLEVSEKVSVVPSRLKWSDVGSLHSLSMLSKADEHGNHLIGNVVDLDSKNTLSYSQKLGRVQPRLVATLGLEDVMVVDTPDATLISAKDRAQDVRLIVDMLKERNAPELVSSKTSLRPWGSWTMLVQSEGFHVKEVEVLPRTRLSLQSHEKRAEHWIVISGKALVTRGDEELELGPNESVFLPIGMKHRLENAGDEMLRIVEVATGNYLGEDDIVRYDDDFGRD